ncbi:band 7 family-domain-containing protein [Blastocladiella britannica]|nr:band 7 family-domain-containing protein [Blastocladiella britannica]
MASRFIDRFTQLAVVLGASASLAQAAMFDVQGGQRALIFDRRNGIRDEVIGEGTHFLIPWVQRPHIYDIRTRPRNISTTTGSRDLQMVSLTLRVLFKPDVPVLAKLHRLLGPEFEERVFASIGNEVLKAAVAQFDASELITQRELVSQRIRDELNLRAKDFHIILDDVSITHLEFGREFTIAVEQKQIAQQEAERAKYSVERAEQEKQAAVIRAEGNAQAAGVISQALSKAGPGLVEFRRIEASREIAQVLAKSPNITYVPSGSSGGQGGASGGGPGMLFNLRV